MCPILFEATRMFLIRFSLVDKKSSFLKGYVLFRLTYKDTVDLWDSKKDLKGLFEMSSLLLWLSDYCQHFWHTTCMYNCIFTQEYTNLALKSFLKACRMFQDPKGRHSFFKPMLISFIQRWSLGKVHQINKCSLIRRASSRSSGVGVYEGCVLRGTASPL